MQLSPISPPTRLCAAATTAAWLLFAPPAQAQLLNGNFATNGGAGQLTVNTTLANWTGGGKEGNFGSPTTPPVFVFPSNAGQTGVTGDAFMGNVSFYGVTAPPTGSFFIAADGDPDWAGSISQTVGGLTAGTAYTLSFNWAGAQQQGYSGATTERWQVNFGSSTQSTATVNTPSQSFAGWQTASMSFTPTGSSQVLRFLAVGAPGGQPPWLLLSNVQLVTAVPEPDTAVLFMLGAAGLLALRWRARRPANA